ncbi:hypothetical protein C8Q80DRAFT_1169806 [Daedaleopsis nitida]|nr:hypothetical protein C8Q80DRAFT_1169806 [Daedaleopsis nitida]
MPPRKKAKTANAPAAVTTASQDAGPSTGAKPARTGAVRRNIRGRRGGLKDMPNMPLDILMEIFAVMHPKDLMNLARSSKSFRALLLSTSARPLWKASMEGVEGLPKCPPYLSEPAFVNLLFFPNCHACLKPNVQSVIFEFSARYCPSCKRTRTQSIHEVSRFMQDVRSITGPGKLQIWFNRIYLSGGTASVHKPEIDDFRARFITLDLKGKKALVAESVERVEHVTQALREFNVWKDSQKGKRSAELDEVRARRVESIKDRLRQMGWEDELDRMTSGQLMSLSYQKFASKAEQLTARGWEKIQEEVFAYMERVKAKRLEYERRAVLHERFKTFVQAYNVYRPPTTKRDEESSYGPQIVDFACMAEFKDILDAPEGDDLSILNNADEMRAKFEAANIQWRQDRKDELADVIRKSLTVPDGVDDPLTLATALFHCLYCGRKDLAYPNVVAHVCTRTYATPKEPYIQAVQAFWSPGRSQSLWTSRSLRFSTEGVAIFRPILQACGLDPDRATHQDAANCEARLVRKGGPAFKLYYDNFDQDGEYDPQEVYDCIRALARTVARPCVTPPVWARITAKERVAVDKVEKELMLKIDLINQTKFTYGCQYCDFAASVRNLEDHLEMQHDIEVDEDDITSHAYIHPDARPETLSLHLPTVFLKRYKKGGKVKADYQVELPTPDLDLFGHAHMSPWDLLFGMMEDDLFWGSDDDEFYY